jgi:hypothetical protein
MISINVFGPAPPFDLTWKDGSGNVIAQNNGVASKDTLTGLSAGYYTIESIDTNGCFADTLFELSQPDSILVSVSEDTLICQNGDANLSASGSGGNGPPYDYNWNNGVPSDSQHTVSPAVNTVYEVTAEDSMGCVSPPEQITVDVYPPINVNTRPDDTICPGGSADLEALPGVGRKTANVILNTAFGEPTVAVDTHIFRVANRTGLAPGKNVREVEDRLLRWTPREFLRDAHHWLILHGRYVCVARKPRCGACVIHDLCEYPDKTED